jgi:predicted transcriptional regulator of viral defense system
MQTKTTEAVRRKIWAKHRGWVFTPKEFASLGPRTSVEQALSRLQRSGKIRRLARGLYEFPKIHPRIGVLSPNPEAIANAVAAKTNSRVMVSGAKAANLLGLSTQVPSQNLFLTDGRARSIRIGNQLVVLKHVASSKLIGAGTEAGLVIQAMRSFGPNGVGKLSLESLSEKLPIELKTDIGRFASAAPAWLQPTLNRLTVQP